MDPSLIPAFHDALVVAQTGSVGEAARRLHKTASAVSQQIRRIEARFGVALFEKVGRGIRPSAAGEALLGSLTRLFDEAASLEVQLGEMTAARVTTLRIAASDYLGEALLLPVLRRLFDEAAPLRFEITTTNSHRGGASGVGRPGRRRRRQHRSRADGRRDAAVHPALLLGGSPADHAGAPPPSRCGPDWPAHRSCACGAGSQGRRVLDECLGRLRLRPLSTIDLPSVSLLLSYVRQGLGMGLVPGLALRRDDRRHLAVEPADVPPIDVRLACRPTLKRTKPLGRFLDGLVEETRRAATEAFD